MTGASTDIAFTPSVKAIQLRRGSRRAYARMEENGGWRDRVTPELAAFIAARDSFFLATANAQGQPYIQHRGGPRGFLRALDERTLGFADYKGNRQYITLGNLADNPRAFLFLIDYERQQRIKIWGRARVVDDDPALIARLAPDGYAERAEQAIVFEIEAWDANCPRHIPHLVSAEEAAEAIGRLEARIAELEALLASREATGVSTREGAGVSTREARGASTREGSEILAHNAPALSGSSPPRTPSA